MNKATQATVKMLGRVSSSRSRVRVMPYAKTNSGPDFVVDQYGNVITAKCKKGMTYDRNRGICVIHLDLGRNPYYKSGTFKVSLSPLCPPT